MIDPVEDFEKKLFTLAKRQADKGACTACMSRILFEAAAGMAGPEKLICWPDDDPEGLEIINRLIEHFTAGFPCGVTLQ